jgi:hypothetical protein
LGRYKHSTSRTSFEVLWCFEFWVRAPVAPAVPTAHWEQRSSVGPVLCWELQAAACCSTYPCTVQLRCNCELLPVSTCMEAWKPHMSLPREWRSRQACCSAGCGGRAEGSRPIRSRDLLRHCDDVSSGKDAAADGPSSVRACQGLAACSGGCRQHCSFEYC